jgi:probable rRNA maturation factor
LSNQQSEVSLRVRRLQRRLKRALPLLPRPLPKGLAEVSVVLVDRATITRIHADFLDDYTETDVITFPYGEIVVCPAVAHDRAADFKAKIEDEVLLYALHGLLHLAGFDDTTPALAKKMAAAQAKLLTRVGSR